MTETAIIGWKAIAEMFNCSERKMRSHRNELKKSGAIFYMWMGRPPRKRVCAWPSRLQRWTALKTAKYNEVI